MKDNKKGFLSWLNSKIKVKKTKEEKVKKTENQDKNIKKKIEKSNFLSSSKENINVVIHNKVKNHDISFMKDKIVSKNNFFLNLKNSLKKTQNFFAKSIGAIFKKKKINNVLFHELEEKMLLADIGVDTTNYIISNLIKDVNDKKLEDSEKVYVLLKENMYNILNKVDVPLKITQNLPFIILVVGVNGSGKTTTVIKLAKKYKLEGKSVLLVAADTFRAAGKEQLQKLADLNEIEVISNNSNSDPAAVVFDAVKIGMSKKIDILIIDTAGRLHNNFHLMEELKKVTRVIKKINDFAPHEIILIIDACNGQNTLKQIKIFHHALNVTGIIMTKLDGTAKGGVIFSLANNFSIPIRYIGIGEKVEDLSIFNSREFIEAIFHK